MRLYHFSPLHCVPGIESQGIVLGMVCYKDPATWQTVVHRNWQWLTVNPDRDSQVWCDPEYSTLPYDRCAVRFEVTIPKTARHDLYSWKTVGRILVPKERLVELNALGNPEEYYLFNGRIKPSWLGEPLYLGERPEFIVRRASAVEIKDRRFLVPLTKDL